MTKDCSRCGGTGMCQECDGEGTVWSGLLGDLRIAKESVQGNTIDVQALAR